MEDRLANFQPLPDNADADEEAEAQNDPELEAPEPKTRKELYAQYSGRGPAAMVFDILSDHKLQLQSIIMSRGSAPLEDLYFRTLRQQKTREGQFSFAANRAANGFFQCAIDCLKQVQSDPFLQRLGMTPPTDSGRLEADKPCDEFEAGIMDHLYKFAFHLCQEIIWTHAHYYWTLPHAIALYLLEDEAERNRGCKHLWVVATAIQKAEDVANPSAALLACLTDVCWNSEQLVRRILQRGLRNKFDSADPVFLEFAQRLYSASGTTKENLESCFNSCQRQIQFMNVNKRASPYMRWFLATLNPHLDARQILPSESDWWKILMSPAGANAIKNMDSHVFNVNATPLPIDEKKLPKRDDDEQFLSQ